MKIVLKITTNLFLCYESFLMSHPKTHKRPFSNFYPQHDTHLHQRQTTSWRLSPLTKHTPCDSQVTWRDTRGESWQSSSRNKRVNTTEQITTENQPEPGEVTAGELFWLNASLGKHHFSSINKTRVGSIAAMQRRKEPKQNSQSQRPEKHQFAIVGVIISHKSHQRRWPKFNLLLREQLEPPPWQRQRIDREGHKIWSR